MAVIFTATRGTTFYFPLQVQAQFNAGPLTDRYASTDPISCLIWPSNATEDAALDIIPTGVWIDANAGTWSYNLTPDQTLALAPGTYKTSARVAHAGNVEDILETDLKVEGVGGVLGPPAVSSVAGQDATALSLVGPLYCTDEDIAVVCLPDYLSLLPKSQVMARGADGYFLPADPWTLVSPSNNFEAQLPAIWSRQGANYLSRAGYVVWLQKPQSQFPSGGTLMGIAAASGTSLTLRQLGMPSTWGTAPAPAAGLTGVEFQIATFYPQIENVTYDLNQQYRIDATLPARAITNLTDMRTLQSTAVATVLLDRYSDETRSRAGDYGAKIDIYKNKLSDLKAKLLIRWGSGIESSGQTNRFSTRIVR